MFADEGVAGIIDKAFVAGGAGGDLRELREVENPGGIFRIVSEVEGLFAFGIEADGGGERASHFAAEAFEGADAPVFEEVFDFVPFEFASCHGFPNDEGAGGAFVGFEGFFENFVPAFWATGGEVREEVADDFARMVFDLRDDFFGELADVRHELGAGDFSLFHLFEAELPFARHFRRSEGVDADAAEGGDEGEALLGDDEVFALAEDVGLGDEAFDDRGAGGGSAQAAFAHGIAEVFVIDEFAGTFHGSQEGRFVEAGGRAGLEVLGFGRQGLGRFVFCDRDDGISGIRLFAIDDLPAWVGDDFAVRAEGFAAGNGDAFGDFEFCGREEDGDEAFADEVKNFGLCVVERFWVVSGGDDGVVVADFGAVEDRATRSDPSRVDGGAGVGCVGGVLQRRERFFDGREEVRGEVSGIRPGVGESFVALVEGLGDLERLFCAEAEAGVCLPLEGSEVEEGRGRLGGRFFFFGDGGGFALAFCGDFQGFLFVPNAFGFCVLVGFFFVFLEKGIEPAPAVFARFHAEVREHFPEISGGEVADFFFAFGEDGEGGGLDASDWSEGEAAALGVEGGEGAGRVDADEPVAFRAADGGIAEVLVFLSWGEVCEAVADDFRQEGIQPEARDRFFVIQVLGDVEKNQFPLASGVAGVDQAGDIWAFEEAGDEFDLRLIFWNWFEIKGIGEDGEVCEAPFAPFFVEFAGEAEFQQVADGKGDDVAFVFEEALGVFWDASEGGSDVGGDAGFFGNDESFWHGKSVV